VTLLRELMQQAELTHYEKAQSADGQHSQVHFWLRSLSFDNVITDK